MQRRAALCDSASLKPLLRPARTKLTANLFRSHSHGAGRVSSKSLMSKMMRRSGVPNPPKFIRWQSPQACTRTPDIAYGQIRSHDPSSAAIKSERALHHSSIPDRNEVRNAVLAALNQQLDRIWAISRCFPCRMRSSQTFVPQSLTCGFPLFACEHLPR